MKYYVVREWWKRWIFTSRDECKNFVVWVKWAKYKSFNSLTEAETALEKWFEPYYTKEKWFEKDIPFEKNSIAVDAACSRNPWITEYQWIDLVTGETIFHTKLWEWTNNIWEFLALVHALAHCKKNNITLPIYSDSKTALAWVRDKKINSAIEPTEDNKELIEMLDRAQKWLKSNTYTNKVLKWETASWGETPADYGRK